MKVTLLKQKLDTGGPLLGSWIQLGDEAMVEMLATGPFDWLCVDLEHTTISIEQCGRIIRLADLAGCPTLVRLSSHDAAQIKRVLDAGAAGIIAPMVKTRAEAEAVVGAATYPPDGERGVGLARAQGYGLRFNEYRDRIADDLVCIAQIEDKEGLANIDEILDVPGISGFFVGPYDLSASIGHAGDFGHPDVIAAVDYLDSVAQREAVLGGIHVVEPDITALRSAVARGYRLVAYASDMLFFAHELQRVTEDLQSIDPLNGAT